MLSDTFLQIDNSTHNTVNFFGLDSESTLSLFTFVLAIATIGLVIVTGLALRKSKMEKLTHESQFMGSILSEFSQIAPQLMKIKTPEECLSYVYHYLTTLDKLCFFDNKGYLPNETMEFFNNYLSHGLGYYNWLRDIDFFTTKPEIQQLYSNIKKSCDKYHISPPNSLLPVFESFRERIKNKKESKSL